MKKIIAVITVMVMAIFGTGMQATASPEHRYTHETMTGTEHGFIAEDGNIFLVEENVEVVSGMQYEVCMDDWGTPDRTDDEIIDFCPLTEVLVETYGVVNDMNEILVLNGNAEGYCFSIPEGISLEKFEYTTVVLNTHWNDDVRTWSVYGTDLEIIEIMNMEGGAF